MTMVLIKNLELSNFNFLSCHLLLITAFAEKKTKNCICSSMAGPLVSSETNKTTCPFFRQHGSISDLRFFWGGGREGAKVEGIFHIK